ncbi:MAG: CPBP family intramembrane metalloprotease [Acidobacteria bacterium]|nr:CPBP family intramembrane metalloprotease [Acidobacteriota bacterium]
MNISTIFFDRTTTLRSGWRFAIFSLAFIFAVTRVGAVVFGAMTAFGFPPRLFSLATLFVNSTVWLSLSLLFGWVCGKYLENLPFRALGAWFTRLWLSHFAMGCLIGAITVGVAIMTAVAFGGLRFGANAADSSAIVITALVSLAIFAVAAAFEEALFRGYILQTFARSGLAAFAIAMTSIFFGAVHLGNPNAGYISTANTMLAGVWFGVAYLKTRDLWFVWGLHLVWNWMQGSIFGIEVSGLTEITTAPVLTEIDSGPVWLTGGDYGIEGGIACTIALVISTLAVQFLPLVKPDEEMLALTSPRAVL